MITFTLREWRERGRERSAPATDALEERYFLMGPGQINHPDLLILDEPAASLDPQGRRDVLGGMEKLREHATIFSSTHILEDAFLSIAKESSHDH